MIVTIVITFVGVLAVMVALGFGILMGRPGPTGTCGDCDGRCSGCRIDAHQATSK